MLKGKGGKPSNGRRLTISHVIIGIICVSILLIAFSSLSFGSEIHPTPINGAESSSSSMIFSNKLRGYANIISNTVSNNDKNEDIHKDYNESKPSMKGVSPTTKSNVKSKTNANININIEDKDEDIVCPAPGGEEEWCHVQPPTKSLFGFSDAPHDPIRWKKAQYLASSNEQVLLSRIIKHFPDPYQYIDGDRSFRGLQKLVDVFIDSKTKLDPLLPDFADNKFSPIRHRHRKLMNLNLNLDDKNRNRNSKINSEQEKEQEHRKLDEQLKDSGETVRPLEVNGKQLVPSPYNYRLSHRAPIVEMGYTAFDKDLNTFFSGNFAGGNFVKKEWFFDEWNKVKDKLDYPFITMCSLNENWGVLSTNFPNRTAGWGACCNQKKDYNLHQFLNHKKTLMFIINQHSNISHPKLLTLPRGLPTQWEHTARVVFDTQHEVLRNHKKQKLLFAASSSWGKRPQILRCISDKMDVKDFWGHTDSSLKAKEEAKKTKTSRRLYYEKLGSAKIGVALPGLGYDCFRTWELLTMGSMVVLERGVGLDRSLWRLPALLVEDFDEINPDLLRMAYTEAMYRADEFEFERLTQNFWQTVIFNVSVSQSIQPLLDKFPMAAELPNFARPKVPYACSNTGTCGKGTKRTPKKMC
jgi:hypothetical protein